MTDVHVERLNPPPIPTPSGYSHVSVPNVPGRLIAIAGQTASEPNPQSSCRVFIDEFREAIANLVTALTAVSSDIGNVLMLRIYVRDAAMYRDNLSGIGKIYRDAFGNDYPSITFVGGVDLYEVDKNIEIEALVWVV